MAPVITDPEQPDPGVPAQGSSRRVNFDRRGTGLPTMAGVAAEAGVSLKTVSRVINGEPTVRPATADRVRAVAAAMGFRRNDAASWLARARPQAVIGLVIEDVTDPFYAKLTRGVEQIARAKEHLVLLSSSDENSDRERASTLALAARGVAGMIVVPHSADHSYLTGELHAGLAVVFVDRPPARIKADCVLSDNLEGARLGVRHLLDAGHRRVAFIGNEGAVYTSTQRLRGFRQAHRELDVEVQTELVVLGPRTEDEAGEAVRRLLDLADPPTAVFSQNNLLTLGAWRAMKTAGQVLGLVGFDDFSTADLLDPPVTVVAQDPESLGRRAAELLFARLDGHTGPARRVVIPTDLVVRG
jgi:LacI family transcriptional regulator